MDVPLTPFITYSESKVVMDYLKVTKTLLDFTIKLIATLVTLDTMKETIETLTFLISILSLS